MSVTKIAGSGSRSTSHRHGSADPDPHQNAMDPEHCKQDHLVLRIRDIQVFLLIGYCLFHLLQVGHELFFFLLQGIAHCKVRLSQKTEGQ
jgi:hypothetical protein